MRTAITLAIDTKGTGQLVAGPEVPVADQRAAFVALTTDNAPKGAARVELWLSNGTRRVFDVVAQKEAEKARAKAEAEAKKAEKAKAKAEAKAKADAGAESEPEAEAEAEAEEANQNL